MFIIVPFILALIVSLFFWLLAKVFLKELNLKAFKMASISTLISFILIIIVNVELAMGVLSGALVLTVVTIVISMVLLLSTSFYSSFVVKTHNKKINKDT